MTHKMLVKKSTTSTSIIFAITTKMLDRLRFSNKMRSGDYRTHKHCKIVDSISDSDLYDIGGRAISAGAIKTGETLSLVEVNEANSFSCFDSITR